MTTDLADNAPCYAAMASADSAYAVRLICGSKKEEDRFLRENAAVRIETVPLWRARELIANYGRRRDAKSGSGERRVGAGVLRSSLCGEQARCK